MGKEIPRFFVHKTGGGAALAKHGRARLPRELEISLGGIQLSYGEPNPLFSIVRESLDCLCILTISPIYFGFCLILSRFLDQV